MKHIKKRSFPTKCKYCGLPVLYWESTKGAKVFFDLPIYGRPFRHICKQRNKKKRKTRVIETYRDHLIKRRKKAETYQCPACGKILETQNSLNSHIKKLRKQDDAHFRFFDEKFDLLVWQGDENKSKLSDFKTHYNLTTMKDRFIFKSKLNPEKRKKFENLISTKRNK